MFASRVTKILGLLLLVGQHFPFVGFARVPICQAIFDCIVFFSFTTKCLSIYTAIIVGIMGDYTNASVIGISPLLYVVMFLTVEYSRGVFKYTGLFVSLAFAFSICVAFILDIAVISCLRAENHIEEVWKTVIEIPLYPCLYYFLKRISAR